MLPFCFLIYVSELIEKDLHSLSLILIFKTFVHTILYVFG